NEILKKKFKKVLIFCGTMLGFLPGYACVTCNRPLQKTIIKTTYSISLFQIFLPFIILGLLIIALWYVGFVQPVKKQALADFMLSKAPLLCTSIVLGIGVGGFIDGIVFHQILQWHELLSNKIP